MKHLKLAAIFACAAMLLSGIASAGMQYTYVQGSVKQGEADSGDGDVDGEAVSASLALGSNFHVGLLTGSGTNDDDESIDGDFDQNQFLIGWHSSVNDQTDVLVEFLSGEIDWDAVDEGDYNAFRFGIRHMVADNLEVGISTTLWDTDSEIGCPGCLPSDDDDDVSASISGRYHLNDSASVGVTWENEDPLLDDDDGTIQFDFRWAFDDVM